MKINFKYLASAVLATLCCSALTSCSDWTEPESVDLKYGTVEDLPNREAYLASIRAYRDTDHKLVYAWFENPAAAQNVTTQAHRISAIPDSVDVVVFNNPNDISAKNAEEMTQMRQQKKMQFAYVVDFDAMKLAYLAHQALATESEPYNVDFIDFLTDSATVALSYAKKGGFDRVMLSYTGKATGHLTAAELKEYKANENTFIGILNDWHGRNPEIAIDFVGKPQNVENKALVADCGVIFLSDSKTAKSTYSYELAMAAASVEGVPTDRFGMIAQYIDPNNDKVGYMSDGSYAVTALGQWGFNAPIKAAGFTNVENDYYRASNNYAVLRQAIQDLNPSNR